MNVIFKYIRMDIKFCINFNEYKQVIAEKGDFKQSMRFSTKIIIIALIIMIPVTTRDILNKDLFNLSLDLIVIIINSLSVMLDIKSIKQDKEYKKMLYGLIDKEDV